MKIVVTNAEPVASGATLEIHCDEPSKSQHLDLSRDGDRQNNTTSNLKLRGP